MTSQCETFQQLCLGGAICPHLMMLLAGQSLSTFLWPVQNFTHWCIALLCVIFHKTDALNCNATISNTDDLVCNNGGNMASPQYFVFVLKEDLFVQLCFYIVVLKTMFFQLKL